MAKRFNTIVWIMLTAVSATVSATTDATSLQSIDFTTTEIARITIHGPWPVEPPDDPGNPFSGLLWAEQLGDLFFHDRGLSGNGRQSCADCHQADKGFSDGLSVAVGAGIHVRNTQSVLDAAQQHWFGWDGGTDSLWAASLRPMLSAIEMNNTEHGIASHIRSLPPSTWANAKNSGPAFPDVSALTDNELSVFVAKLIGAFTRTINSPETAFDRLRVALLNNDEAAIQSYPDSAKRGLKLFLGDANCRLCHFGANFSNGEFHDTGRPFLTGVGQVDPGRYTGIQELRKNPYNLLGEFAVNATSQQKRKTASVKLTQLNWGQWRTPSLRNLKFTAPYMHDGSIATLRGVVDAYADINPDRLHSNGEAILKPLNLSDQQRDDLVAFLLSLSH